VNDSVTFKRVKSIVFGKNDEDFFIELTDSGYFDKNWNCKIKDLIKADFYGRKEKIEPFTKEQESAIVDIIKRHIGDINLLSKEEVAKEEVLDEVVADKEVIDKSKEAILALSNLQRFRKK
jgi:hypothetical protein